MPTRDEAEALSDAELIGQLVPIRGVGQWTVEMLLIFALGRLDVLPLDDFGLRKGIKIAFGLEAMPSKREMLELTERLAAVPVDRHLVHVAPGRKGGARPDARRSLATDGTPSRGAAPDADRASRGSGSAADVPDLRRPRLPDAERDRRDTQLTRRSRSRSAGNQRAHSPATSSVPRPPDDHRRHRADQRRERAGFELAQLVRGADEDGVDRRHPPAHRVGRVDLHQRLADEHADHVGGAQHEQAGERQRQAGRQAEADGGDAEDRRPPGTCAGRCGASAAARRGTAPWRRRRPPASSAAARGPTGRP